ncbi:PREDICTED: basic leucine zipper 23-like [Ipomoea nil]|uniref:basic leucine zipper 23-like n=1 Tax=Ipomoea nil TaxID=35883 RepID=UPI000900A2B5|nr:PREDICTED: basic leucine zipper 23-like [Ipomoea nil]XP_019154684.1 PREDICTED: basic leucine zipper 23-like [Ipomoea nil]
MEVSDHFLVLNSSDSSSNNVKVQPSLSVGSVLDGMLRNNAQTYTHTHTHIYPNSQSDGEPRRRASGNREAVRKYREKKKAHTAYLEEEVRKLRAVNEQMVKKVERQVVLEAEVMRLRALLLKLRDKIDSESGAGHSGFPFQKHCDPATPFEQGDCAVQSSGKGPGTGLMMVKKVERFRGLLVKLRDKIDS